ncbi:phosphoribosylamine--glycine ligase [uncultured Eudoraea sp.]|uniref:phosphoribosylamine--glycine ligase n=1 Tax=uncultured Eudoraea sp. TaxID=1035614 RepID=UPI0026323AAD|nr:phosphoribosylamine--glycine ligase [uncultured Eudoraea sp.]
MNILILGSGGREHTLAWKINQTSKLDKLFVAPGNAGTEGIAQNIPIDVNDFEAIKRIVKKEGINMVVVGPEDPLVNGIHDFFLQDPELKDVSVIGPAKKAATLEGSKEFAKQFMIRHKIPTASYKSFTSDEIEEGLQFLDTIKPPYVLKADGLAAGKGVLILESLDEAKKELRDMLLNAKFGNASSVVVIEEFLSGIELSCFVLTDGKDYKVLPMAKDYKRIGEGDTGLNTGGMGAISPVPFVTEEFLDKVHERIIKPTIEGLHKDQLPYKGFIFIGLIKVGDDPFVIEYNVRLGDPETEVVIPRVKNDLIELFDAVAKGELNSIELEIDERTATTVMLVSGGYPQAYKKGIEINGIEDVEDSIVYHAGTQLKDGKILTNGGRVMAITSFGSDFREGLSKSYQNIKKINFDNMYYRKDLGFDL